MTTPTRGERNCNPGNIDRDGTHWLGIASDQSGDPRFIVFTDPIYGIRAIGKELLAYYSRHNLHTVRGIINRWAPPIENDTDAYVNAVAKHLSVAPDDGIDVTQPACLEILARAIIQHENGRVSYSDDVIERAVQMALA